MLATENSPLGWPQLDRRRPMMDPNYLNPPHPNAFRQPHGQPAPCLGNFHHRNPDSPNPKFKLNFVPPRVPNVTHTDTTNHTNATQTTPTKIRQHTTHFTTPTPQNRRKIVEKSISSEFHKHIHRIPNCRLEKGPTRHTKTTQANATKDPQGRDDDTDDKPHPPELTPN